MKGKIMANNIKKYVECIGTDKMAKSFFAWFHSITKSQEDSDDLVKEFDIDKVHGSIKELATSALLDDLSWHVIDYIGVSTLPDRRLSVEFHDITPHGNMERLLGMMRKVYPDMEFVCTDDNDEISES
jgi:hypothetical protein